MRLSVYVCVVLALAATAAGRRFGGFGGSRRGGSTSSKHRTPAPPPPPTHSGTYHGGSSGHFINAERGSPSSSGNNAGNHASPFGNNPQTNGQIGFEKLGGPGNQGNHKIGFDKVNSEVLNKPASSHIPNAPPGPVGPPPSYNGHFGGTNDHPPAYPGRPVNAPPAYYPSNPHPNQYQGQGYQGQQYGGFGTGFPQQNQYTNHGYGSYQGAGSYQAFGGSPYSGTPGYFSGAGAGYHGNTYGGNPFGGGGVGGNTYYSPNNFGYSNNPGYFGGHQDYQKKSRFGGMPIPIPIPIPIPFGGFGGGGLFGGHSHNHRVLDTFIKSSNSTPPGNSSTSLFLLNNSTVTPCTSDHFVYETAKVSTLSCTAQFCTAVKVFTITNVSAVETTHGAALTVCVEQDNLTVSYHGDNVTPTVSEVHKEALTVCRNVSKNETVTANNETMTTVQPDTTTVESTTMPSSSADTTKVCETVNCASVEMCLPAIEVVKSCTSEPCPFRRTGYKPCITVKVCRAPNVPVSTFATLNTTISQIDEYNCHNSIHDVANLTLISFHPPVVPTFKCSNNSSSPDCLPPQQACPPSTSGTPPPANCSSTTTNAPEPGNVTASLDHTTFKSL